MADVSRGAWPKRPVWHRLAETLHPLWDRGRHGHGHRAAPMPAPVEIDLSPLSIDELLALSEDRSRWPELGDPGFWEGATLRIKFQERINDALAQIAVRDPVSVADALCAAAPDDNSESILYREERISRKRHQRLAKALAVAGTVFAGGEDALAVLLQIATAAPRPERIAAIYALANVKALPMEVFAQALTDAEILVRLRALETLGRGTRAVCAPDARPDFINAVRRALDDPDDTVRAMALDTLHAWEALDWISAEPESAEFQEVQADVR